MTVSAPIIRPRTPPGVLELLPAEQVIHDAMLDTIRAGYRRFGFMPIETPVFELSEVLLTKSGGETERQVYYVQSAGAREQSSEPDLALRFDLTVPLARYVAEHEQELVFPFRRYQIQRVYRGERPQRGRYREFYQCDIDVIDRDDLSVRHDAEVAATMISILTDLDIGPATMRINNRRLLGSLLDAAGVTEPDAQTAALREIDKLDRKPREAVATALVDGGMAAAEAARLLELISSTAQGPEEIGETLAATGDEGPGTSELREVCAALEALEVPRDSYVLDLSIARGLDYYTGTVFETTLDDHPELGSICSGGRYDDLASQYTTTRLPGVGLSIGFTRLFWQLREAGLLRGQTAAVEAAVMLLEDHDLAYALQVASLLRARGISTETTLTPAKLGRQLKNADRAGVRVAVIAGSSERERGVVTVKELASGEQREVAMDEVAEAVLRTLDPGAP